MLELHRTEFEPAAEVMEYPVKPGKRPHRVFHTQAKQEAPSQRLLNFLQPVIDPHKAERDAAFLKDPFSFYNFER